MNYHIGTAFDSLLFIGVFFQVIANRGGGRKEIWVLLRLFSGQTAPKKVNYLKEKGNYYEGRLEKRQEKTGKSFL